MNETSKSISVWGTKTFGDADSILAYALRAQEELTELIDAIQKRESKEDIIFEAADVTILLHRLTATLGVELSKAVDQKMKINRNRVWAKSGNGVGQHK